MMRTTLRGEPFWTHGPRDYLSAQILRTHDFFEVAILEALRERITGGVLVDVGASIGNHATYFARFLPHAAVHAFEPHPDNLAVLRRNVARFPSVVVHDVALSDRPRTLRLAIPDRRNMGHAVVIETDPYPPEGGHRRAVTVAAATLDGFGLEDVALLKIDAEWHEPEVLAGARRTIERSRPLIVIEDWAHAYAALLEPLGYRLAVSWELEHQTFLWEPVP